MSSCGIMVYFSVLFGGGGANIYCVPSMCQAFGCILCIFHSALNSPLDKKFILSVFYLFSSISEIPAPARYFLTLCLRHLILASRVLT